MVTDPSRAFGLDVCAALKAKLEATPDLTLERIAKAILEGRRETTLESAHQELAPRTVQNVVSTLSDGEIGIDDVLSLASLLGDEDRLVRELTTRRHFAYRSRANIDLQLRRAELAARRAILDETTQSLDDPEQGASDSRDQGGGAGDDAAYLGTRLINLLGARDRFLDVFVREGLPPDGDKAMYYSSPGQSALLVSKGSVVARFAGIDDKTANVGDIIIYDGSHPHCFLDRNRDSSARVLDISAEEDGIGKSLFVHKYPFGKSLDLSLREHTSALSSVRCNVAMAISGSPMPLNELAVFSGLKTRRISDLRDMKGRAPRITELEMIGSALRIDPSRFLAPFGLERKAAVIRCFSRQYILDQFDIIESGRAHCDESLREHKPYRDGHWRVSPIGETAQGGAGSHVLQVMAFSVDQRGEVDFMEHDKDTQGEELIVGLAGTTCVSLKNAATKYSGEHQDVDVIVDESEVCWYSTKLKHAFTNVGDTKWARSLYFWTPRVREPRRVKSRVPE